MKEGHTPLLLSERPPPGPRVTAAMTSPADSARHTGLPALPWPAKQHLGSVLREQKAAAGREGGSGGSAAEDQCCCGRHRARKRGWSQLPAALCSQNDRVKKKRGREKHTNTAKQLLGPDAEFHSPLTCLFFAFVPVEGSLRSGTRQEAAQAAARGKALDRRQSRSPASPGPGRRAGASWWWGAQHDPAVRGLGHPARPPPGCSLASAAAAAEKPRSIFTQCRTRQRSLMREHYNQLVMLNF